MQKINSTPDLKSAIIHLEEEQYKKGKILKEHFHLAYDGIQPVNVIKSTIQGVTQNLDLKNDLLIGITSLSTAYLSKKILANNTTSPLKKFLEMALLLGITHVVTKHPDTVKLAGKITMSLIGKMSGFPVNDEDENP